MNYDQIDSDSCFGILLLLAFIALIVWSVQVSKEKWQTNEAAGQLL